MADNTEGIRRLVVDKLNSDIESSEEDTERKRLEKLHGKVWDTKELTKNFEVEGFMAPFVSVRRKKDNKKGTMLFQHNPRFYWGFK